MIKIWVIHFQIKLKVQASLDYFVIIIIKCWKYKREIKELRHHNLWFPFIEIDFIYVNFMNQQI